MPKNYITNLNSIAPSQKTSHAEEGHLLHSMSRLNIKKSELNGLAIFFTP
jgi:hypothetical protein